ncbi:MAG TPA: hypothetical protein VF170_02410 [Planctomycetaceae bacterium]
MQEFEIELGIGDVLRIGDDLYTVIDIEDGEVCFRVDPAEEFVPAPAVPPGK